MVKIIWYQAALLPQMDNSVVFARLRQCALQWGYIGTTWQIWLNLSLLLLTRVQKTNGKSIGSATFAQLTAECRRAHLGVFFPLIIAPFTWGIWAQCMYASLGPTQVHNPNGISLGSVVFAQVMAQCSYTLQRAHRCHLANTIELVLLSAHQCPQP